MDSASLDGHSVIQDPGAASYLPACLRLSVRPRARPWRPSETHACVPRAQEEFALGLSMGHPEGSGTGPDLARRMVEELDIPHTNPISTVKYVEAFALFCDGMGVDRISDAFCNIVKAKFIEYTKEVLKRHGLPIKSVMVRHASWTSSVAGTTSASTCPRAQRRPVGSCPPERFLKDIPLVTADGLWSWAEGNVAEVLRDDLNHDLDESLNELQRAAPSAA